MDIDRYIVTVTDGSVCCVCVHALCYVSTPFLAPIHTFTFLLKLQVERDIFKILKHVTGELKFLVQNPVKHSYID